MSHRTTEHQDLKATPPPGSSALAGWTQTEAQVRSFCPEGHGDFGNWLFGELNLRPSGCGTAATRGQRACCELMSVGQDRAQRTNNGCNTAANTQLLWSDGHIKASKDHGNREEERTP